MLGLYLAGHFVDPVRQRFDLLLPLCLLRGSQQFRTIRHKDGGMLPCVIGDESLLVDASDAFQGPDIEGVLGAAVAGAFGDELAVGLLVGFGLLEGCDLRLGQDQALPQPSWPRALSAGASWSADHGAARPSAPRTARSTFPAWPVRWRPASGHEAGWSIAIAATAASISGGARFFKD